LESKRQRQRREEESGILIILFHAIKKTGDLLKMERVSRGRGKGKGEGTKETERPHLDPLQGNHLWYLQKKH
jgi:hypothetical protein